MLSNVLRHYKRLEVQKLIVDAAHLKEAVGSYGGKGYAKRPDVLMYPADVMELVKNGVTSFHISEETWSNPLDIKTGSSPKESNDLRSGWDLVLDIDCPYWEFAKIVTWLFVRSLQDHGISSISVKFSGNKGFHIGVPFEAFPSVLPGDVPTKDFFPDGPRQIAQYLLHHISKRLIKVKGNTIIFGDSHPFDFEQIQLITGKKSDELLLSYCDSCGQVHKEGLRRQFHFTCGICGSNYTTEEDLAFRKCLKCNVLMDKSELDLGRRCCPKPLVVKTFNPLSIVEVDTVLIAPRHLYRAPYSYHEKSGLVSVPIPVDHIMEFEKDEAKLEDVVFTPWLPRDSASSEEGRNLLLSAIDFHAREEQRKQEKEQSIKYSKDFSKEFDDVQTAIPDKFFPPCIQLVMKGLPDGKKRALFMLINFLSSCGWSYEEMESWLTEWNKKNPEPIRQVYLLGQLRYTKQNKKKALPPNCDNKAYYKDFHVCRPDGFCKYVKNPANYAIRKAKLAQQEEFRNGKGKKTQKQDNPAKPSHPEASKTPENPDKPHKKPSKPKSQPNPTTQTVTSDTL